MIDGGNFDWEANKERFPTLNEPDPSYHGAVWTEAAKPLGPIAYILRARVVLLRDLGACMSPFNAFQTIQGLETMPLRMERHCENGEKVAKYLAKHEKISHAIHPSLQDGEMKRRADAYLSGGYGALVGFELKGGKEAGMKFIDSSRCSTMLQILVMQEVWLFTLPRRPIHSCPLRSKFKPA